MSEKRMSGVQEENVALRVSMWSREHLRWHVFLFVPQNVSVKEQVCSVFTRKEEDK